MYWHVPAPTTWPSANGMPTIAEIAARSGICVQLAMNVVGVSSGSVVVVRAGFASKTVVVAPAGVLLVVPASVLHATKSASAVKPSATTDRGLRTMDIPSRPVGDLVPPTVPCRDGVG